MDSKKVESSSSVQSNKRNQEKSQPLTQMNEIASKQKEDLAKALKSLEHVKNFPKIKLTKDQKTELRKNFELVIKSANQITDFQKQDQIIENLKKNFGIRKNKMNKLYEKQLELKLPDILKKADGLPESEKLLVYNEIANLIKKHKSIIKKTINIEKNSSKSKLGKYLKNAAIKSFWISIGEQIKEVSNKNPRDQESALQKIKDTSFTLIDKELRNILNVENEGKGIFTKIKSKNQIGTIIRELKQGTLALTLEKHLLENKITPMSENIKAIDQDIESVELSINKLKHQRTILKKLPKGKNLFTKTKLPQLGSAEGSSLPNKNQQKEIEQRIQNFKERMSVLIKSRLQAQKELRPFTKELEHINERRGNKIQIPLQQQKNDEISEPFVNTEANQSTGAFPNTEKQLSPQPKETPSADVTSDSTRIKPPPLPYVPTVTRQVLDSKSKAAETNDSTARSESSKERFTDEIVAEVKNMEKERAEGNSFSSFGKSSADNVQSKLSRRRVPARPVPPPPSEASPEEED
ncbi:MAG: hypothetical protein OXD32_07155 [Endozoicomonadaceae bacterium]|nr:hypothetical protein [Endozoicomonadaceae bacterium]